MSEAKSNNFTVTDFEHAKVKVKQGWLQGYIEKAYRNTLKIFKGIPFAAPPVGDLRFKYPQDPASWRGIRRATRYGPAAIQQVQEMGDEKANIHGVPQMLAPSQYEEDCLYLNVWSPAKTQEDKLPVFIWVHGGGMIAGSGVEVVCTGEGLAGRKDMVVVTINYRLGLFGFFAHPELTKETGGTSGNYGLYDIRKACLWVKENIAAFGGDPDNITVAGQSGGARAAGALLVSPLMNGIVQHVSVESGAIAFGATGPCLREEVEKASQALMESVGVSTIEELRAMDAWELFDAYQATMKPGSLGGIRFCVDGEFLPDNYYEMVTAGKFNDFDVMIGGCAQEWLVRFGNGLPLEEYHAHLEEAFPDAAEQMKIWYPASNDIEAEKACSSIASDILAVSSLYVAKMCHKAGKKAFAWIIAKENETEKGHNLGCPHCAEMPYVFGRVDTGERDPFFPYHWVGADYDFMELIQDYWYHFAKNGDPNCEGRPYWKSYSEDFDLCRLDNNTHMISKEEQERYRYLFNKVVAKGKNSQNIGGFGMPRID